MRTFRRILVTLLFVVPLADGQDAGDTKEDKSPKAKIEFTDLGINLYGKFRFESEGELFDIIDNDSKILISAGAVLTCIRQSYTIGYFAGGATITEEGKRRAVSKVFFVLKPSGEITYHSPSPDGNFPGQRLPDAIEFGTLYDPLNGKAEQAAPGQPAIRPESKPEGNQKPQPKSEGRSR